jgi:hypothetical protein
MSSIWEKSEGCNATFLSLSPFFTGRGYHELTDEGHCEIWHWPLIRPVGHLLPVKNGEKEKPNMRTKPRVSVSFAGTTVECSYFLATGATSAVILRIVTRRFCASGFCVRTLR